MYALFELFDDGARPRIVTLAVLPRTGALLHDDASLRWATSGVGAGGAPWQAVWRAPCVLNATGWPSWDLAAPALLASFNGTSATGPGAFIARGGGLPPRFPDAPGGRVVLFDATPNENAGPHLGAVARGAGAAVAWTASPWGHWNVSRGTTTYPPFSTPVPTLTITNADGTYGAAFPNSTFNNGTSIDYAASYAVTAGNLIIYDFYGEGEDGAERIMRRESGKASHARPARPTPAGWQKGEASQWVMFDAATGLFLGQFGITNTVDAGLVFSVPGVAGNAMTCTLLWDGGATAQLFHNDESQHAGVHRWTVTVPTLVELSEL